MQQEVSERQVLLCRESGPACGVAFLQLPFHCPRCGERQKLRGLSSVRAYFDHGNAYHTMHSLSPATRWRDLGDGQKDRKSSDTSCTERCRSSAQEPGEPGESAESEVTETSSGKEGRTCPGEPPGEPPEATQIVSVESRIRPKLEEALRAANGTMARRLRRVSTDLAQVDLELLRAHARFQHLAREKLQVSERERALCRQVDAAVVEISQLREQLSHSEQELEKKEMEVISIHNFLEAAARHEMCGKVRLQCFIENLLQRIALAERLLEFYHSASNLRNCRNYTVSWVSGHLTHLPHAKRKVFSKPFQGDAGIQTQLLSIGAHVRGGVDFERGSG